jgi:hypothetical protein
VITRIALAWLAVLLAVTLAAGRDEPKKDEPKKDEKPQTAKEQFDTMAKEFAAERQKILAEARKAKGEEQQKLFEKYQGLGNNEYMGKMLKLAEDNPKEPVAVDALFWVFANTQGEDKKIEKPMAAAVADMPLADLARRLQTAGGMTDSEVILEACLKRAEKDVVEKAAGDVLAWVASNAFSFPRGKTPAAVKTAGERFVEKHPDHPAMVRHIQMLAQSGADEAVLKGIVEKVTEPKVKAEAVYAMGQLAAGKLDKVADNPAELEKAAAAADKLLSEAVELFGKAEMKARKTAAESELTAFRTIRVGKEAPEIEGKDLDGKEFKLSDYRGKVVLLDFWGHW